MLNFVNIFSRKNNKNKLTYININNLCLNVKKMIENYHKMYYKRKKNPYKLSILFDVHH